jgi:FAD/FMN-containing dehydrogenase
MVVVLPDTTQQVSRVLAYCHAEGIKVVPRGAGTSLSGGALPLADGVLLGMAKFNRIREIDFDNRVAVVEPGVTNLAVTDAVEHGGFYYAPDPSSQIACTIGGNVAENSGGVHSLKYGMTTNNVVGALLIIELDGPRVEVDYLVERVETIAKACRLTTLKISQSEDERLLFWSGRKAAFPAMGRISPDYCMDGTIPRAQLPRVLKRMRELSEKYRLRLANVFHAGDGNLHPLILYDANVPGEFERCEAFGADILKLCVEVGGVLTGEHGVGVEKRDLMPTMFSETDLNQQQRLKCAFDVPRF